MIAAVSRSATTVPVSLRNNLLFPDAVPLFTSPFAGTDLPIAIKETAFAKKRKASQQLLFAQLQPGFAAPFAEADLPIAKKATAYAKIW
jgi:hypothetical protein